MIKIMTTELYEVEVDFYKYTCDTCDNPIYANYDCPINCPHCEEKCNEKTTSNKELVSDIILYSIDPKTGELSIWE